jgi:MFS family permease
MRTSYGWVIVAVGALMTCVALGAMFSLAIFLQPMATATGWSRAGISSAMTLNFLIMGLGAFGWGVASDRYGTRIVVLASRRGIAWARIGAGKQGGIAHSIPTHLRNSCRGDATGISAAQARNSWCSDSRSSLAVRRTPDRSFTW